MIEQGFHRIKFAGPLKDMLRAFLYAQGVPPDKVERMIEGDLKEVPVEELGGATPRYAMQTLGTEWGRGLNETLWVDSAKRAASAAMRAGKAVVIDDVRFPNEAEAIKRLGGCLIRVYRPGAIGLDVVSAQHESEKQIDSIECDYTIVNDGDLEDLRFKVEFIVSTNYPHWREKMQATSPAIEAAADEFLASESKAAEPAAEPVTPALEADASEVPVDFPAEVVATVKQNAVNALTEALAAANRFEMPLIAVVVMDNKKDQSTSTHDAAFAAINCPFHVADSVLRAGMGALYESQQGAANGTPAH